VRLAPSPQQNGLIAPEITSDISATTLNSPLMRPYPSPSAQMLAIARLPFGNMARSLKNGGRPRRGETGSAAAYPGSGEQTPGIRNVGVNPEIEFGNIVAIVPILRRFSDCLPTR
jgi:hypothetical protein